MSDRTEITRRSILKLMGGAGASFMLGSFSLACADPLQKSGAAAGPSFVPNVFVKIDPDGQVTITASRSDMGQGIRTTFAMLVAEEMDADWSKVKVVQAHADAAFGGQGTGGSSSVTSSHRRLRKMGATTRAMLIEAAAKTWNVEASTCHTEPGKVVHSSGKSLSYGELAGAASKLQVPTGDIPLKKRADYRIVGKPKNRVDNPAVVTGKAIYAQDVKVAGALYAVIARPPKYGATLKSVDDAAARKVAGVVDVVRVSSGVAVVAKNTWAAFQGRDALKLVWDDGPNAGVTSATLLTSLKAAVGPHREMPEGKVVSGTLDFPYLAHATMEPQNAVADVREDSCTIWAPTQSPEGVLGMATRLTGLPKEKVRVNVTLLGGGFGRRFDSSFVQEAVEISKAVKKPIKLQWTREDDTKNDSYRPMSHHAFQATLGPDGMPLGWSHQVLYAGGWGNGKFEGANIPYEIPNSGRMQKSVNAPIPVGAWRSVEHSQISVTDECFIDELAKAAGQDPYQYRRKLIRNPRLLAVLDLAAQKAGWGKPLAKGRAQGIACFEGYGSYAAHVVELSIVDGEVVVHKVVCAVDCGLAINPKGVEAQIQGAASDALSTSLKARITIEGGAVRQSSFSDYEWLTFDQMPKVETHIISGSDEPGGMGEVGYPGAVAATANAVAALTGSRPRRFPLRV